VTTISKNQKPSYKIFRWK